MTPFVRLIRSNMSRRIFVWFCAIVMASVVASAVVFSLFVLAGTPTWHKQVSQYEIFAAHQFEHVWDDEERMALLLDDLHNDIGVDVTLRSADGEIIDSRGVECTQCAGPTFETVVARDGVILGSAIACASTTGPPKPVKGFAILTVILLMIWIGSLIVARAIVAPLKELTDVADALGRGELAQRAELAKDAGGEFEVLADAFHEMSGRIERQLKDQKTLLAGVSHELRTPLGHLMMLIEMHREVGLGADAVAEFEREVLEMDDLVDQLLATSRLDFELRDHRTIDAANITLEAMDRAGVAPELLEVVDHASFCGDTMLIRRALANLLRNAKVHGGGVTRVEVSCVDDVLTIAVEDDGPGLPSSERQRLFDAFVQNRATNSGSLGLGLFLVKRVAAVHGGDVFADERPDRGARIGFSLPVETDY